MDNVNDDQVTETKSEFVSRDDYEKVVNDYKAMLGRFKSSEAKIAELSESIKTKPKSEPEHKVDHENKLQDQLTSLQEEVKSMRTREENVKRGAARQSFVSELIKYDAQPELAEIAVDSILSNNKDKIKIAQTSSGAYSVSVEDSIGEQVSVTDYIKNYMESDVGKMIKKTKKAPKGGFLDGHSANTIKISSLQYSKLTPEQRKNGNYEIT